MHPFSAYYFSAEVAKSVDAVDSKSTVEIRAGSSPAFGTIKYRANKKPPRGGFFVSDLVLTNCFFIISPLISSAG